MQIILLKIKRKIQGLDWMVDLWLCGAGNKTFSCEKSVLYFSHIRVLVLFTRGRVTTKSKLERKRKGGDWHKLMELDIAYVL